MKWTYGLIALAILALGIAGCDKLKGAGEKNEPGHEGHDHSKHGEHSEAKKEGGHEGHDHGEHEGHDEAVEEPGHEGHGHAPGEHEAAPEAGHEGHDHGSHEGHDHPELALDELDDQRCEHQVATVACDECRYELGVVEVPEDVASELLVEAAAKPAIQTFRELSLRCETGRDKQKSVEVVALLGGRVEEIRKSLGQSVEKGDVLAVLASDEFSEVKLAHEKFHQELELARKRFDRLVRVQGNLNQLLEKLRGLDAAGVDVAAISKLEIGGAKAELMAAANGFVRARADWERDTRLVADGRKLLERVRGEANHDVDKLVVGKWKAEVLAARAELRLAKTAKDRLDKLSSRNLASRKELDEARRNRDVAAIRFDAAVEQVALDIGGHEVAALEMINTARSRLESAVEQVVLDLEVGRLESQQALDRAQTQVVVSHRRLGLFGFSEEEIDKLADRGSEAFATLEVRAPNSGTVLSQMLALGQVVEQGQPLFQVADLSSLWTWCHVYEKDLAQLAEGTLPLPAQVRTDAFPGRVFTGTLDYLDRVTDEHSRTVRARVVTSNKGGLLRPNMFVRAAVDVPTAGGGILSVPATAVVSDDGEDFVFLHWRGNYWVKRSVTVARRTSKIALLEEGLSPGDMVAARGAFFLKSDVLREKMGAGCAH
jgi:membrane fusion protein, heavy metal efflux system